MAASNAEWAPQTDWAPYLGFYEECNYGNCFILPSSKQKRRCPLIPVLVIPAACLLLAAAAASAIIIPIRAHVGMYPVVLSEKSGETKSRDTVWLDKLRNWQLGRENTFDVKIDQGLGSGAPLHSFLKSVVLTTTQFSPSFEVKATLDKLGLPEEIMRVSESPRGWRKFGPQVFDGYIYGDFSSIDGQWITSGENLTYVYSDFHTVLIGKWVEGKMMHARRAAIKGYRCKGGIMEIQTTKPKSTSADYFFEQYEENFITSYPTVMDPHDMRTVFVSDSKIPEVDGDGLFAKRDMASGTLVAYYAGSKIFDYKTIIFDNMTIDEREDRHKNLMSFDDHYDLNVPDANIVTYRATIGHKANHAFDANAVFCFVANPRFGEIRCLEAIRDIKKGEEILVDYQYRSNSKYTPRWYRKLQKERLQKSMKSLGQKRKKKLQ